MAYKSFTELTVYSSTGCPPVSLSVTVTCTSLSDNALVVTVPMTGAVYKERMLLEYLKFPLKISRDLGMSEKA